MEEILVCLEFGLSEPNRIWRTESEIQKISFDEKKIFQEGKELNEFVNS